MELLAVIIGSYIMYLFFKNLDDSGTSDVLDVWDSAKEDKKKLNDAITKTIQKAKPFVNTAQDTFKKECNSTSHSDTEITLQKYKILRKKGVLSQGEYEQLKKDLLSK